MMHADQYTFRPDPRVQQARLVSHAGHRSASEPARHIVLTGFMGTGKTVVGRRLAEILGCDFVDTDALIEEREGLTITEIFAQRGEETFRGLERDLCRELAGRENLVVATGGGTLVPQENFDAMAARGRILLLHCEPEVIAARLSEDRSRPLLEGEDGHALSMDHLTKRIAELLGAREPAYRRFEERFDSSQAKPEALATQIAARQELPLHALTLELAPGGRIPPSDVSHIEIGRGLLTHLGHRLRARNLEGPVFLLMAASLQELYLDQVGAALDEAQLPWHLLPVRDGDGEKTYAQVGELVGRLADLGATRDATAVTFGGGVTGDMGGFAASIYMRGMPLVQVPTTLLAQVDASIGGKVGVNHPRVKNLVGAFHQPHLVLIDPCVLRTLTRAEISNGMAEVIKTAVLGSPALFEDLVQVVGASDSEALTDAEFLEKCVAECARIKATVVQRDPFERGERKVLNLGHTAGHALEAIGGYAGLTHGQAVSVGLVIAGRIAAGRGMWPRQRHDQTVALLAQCGLPVTAPAFRQEAFLQSLHLDKKKRDGRLTFVLPLAVGCCAVVQDVDDDEILAALAAD